jgi:hypothetical protein
VVGAGCVAGVVGYVVVGIGFRLGDASETAPEAARHSFAMVSAHEAVGSPGVRGRGAIHFLDRTQVG